MKKKALLIVLVLLVLLSSVYSATFSKNIELRKVSTKYFDIVYPEISSKTASLLCSNADAYYDEIALNLNVKKKFRMTVTITPDKNLLNAHFSPYPYNHIVLYDVISSDVSFINFENLILDVFYHELTHAVSMNIRDDFTQKVSNVFSDSFNFQYLLYLPLSFLEGVTVSFESLKGLGRLNNGFKTQKIKEAKIEGVFPKFTDIATARDVYPIGDFPYIFGGSFSSYLQETYSMEKYATLFHQTGRFQFNSVKGIFKKVYGLSLKDAWNDYYESIEIPSNLIDPTVEYSSDSLLQSLVETSNGFYFYDKTKNSIFKFIENSNNKIIEKLINSSSEEMQVSVKEKENLLLTSNVTEGLKELRLFNLQTNKIIKKYKDIRLGALLNDKEGNTVLTGLINEGLNCTLVFLSLEGEEVYSKVDLAYGSLVYDMIDIENNSCAFILQMDGNTNIALYNYESGNLKIINNPIPILIKDLSKTENGLLFSWVKKENNDALPCLGKLNFSDLTKISFLLSHDNILGGVNHPLEKDDTIYFISNYFDHDEISSLLNSNFEMQEFNTTYVEIENWENNRTKDFPNLSSSVKYNKILDFQDVTILPSFTFSVDSQNNYDSYYGFTFITGDPTETYLLYSNLLYAYEDKTIIINSELESNFNFFSHSEGFQTVVNTETNAFDISIFHEGNLNKELSNEMGDLNFAYEVKFKQICSNPYLYWQLNPNWSLVKNKDLGAYGEYGFIFGTSYEGKIKSNLSYTDLFSFYVKGEFNRLLPFNSIKGFTFNLPSDMYINYSLPRSLFLNFTTILFGYEIQNSFEFLNLYFQRVEIEAASGFLFYLFDEVELNNLSLNLKLSFSPVIGTLITQLKPKLLIGYDYIVADKKWQFNVSFRL